jgi:hypothetical protein
MRTSVFEQVAERVAQEHPESLCYARLPGFVLRADLKVNESSVLLATPRTQDECSEDEFRLHSLFDRAGLRGPGMSTFFGNPLCSATLLTWSNAFCSSEAELLMVPLTTLNLYVRSSWPLVDHGCVFATRSPSGEIVSMSVPRFLRTERVAQTPELGAAGEAEHYTQMEIDLQRLSSALSTACRADTFFLTAVQLASLADAKYDEVRQVRTRIIEYSVAIESLLLEQEAELSLRFALRCAVLLAGSGAKLDPWNTAKNIYKMRSMAVHASEKGKNLATSDAETARLFLYQCLIRYMTLVNGGLTKKDIIALLDQALLSDNYARQLQENSLGLGQIPLTPVRSSL